MHNQRLAHDVPASHSRVKRAVRILEYHLHLAPHFAHRAPVKRVQVFALEDDVPFGRLVELQYAAPRCGLAAAAFAHQPKRFAPLNGEAHIVDRLDVRNLALKEDARSHRKVHLQVAHIQQDLFVGRSAVAGAVLRLCLCSGHPTSPNG